ncbi:unnamed protein product [Pylaiella littoralis]
MFEPNLSVDVSLLAIVLGLYATNSDRNLVLILVCCLFAHISLTNDDFRGDGRGGALGAAAEAAAGDDGGVVDAEPSNRRTVDHYDTTVSSDVLGRQLSTPQTGPNGNLASARNSFFESLVS